MVQFLPLSFFSSFFVKVVLVFSFFSPAVDVVLFNSMGQLLLLKSYVLAYANITVYLVS